ncbi:MAG: hypothetical protein J6W10_02260 [Kiritimatiellae bacterium]|nr:hypothetical protein [Kiritimatiellia bacterium]
MEADDWAVADKIHRLECRIEELKIENAGLEDDLSYEKDKVCDLIEREAYQDEMTTRRGLR